MTFLDWMVFALPLAFGLMIAGTLLLTARFQLRGLTELPEIPLMVPDRRGRLLMLLFIATVAAWLTGPIHGTSSAIVALIATAVLFGSGLLHREDIKRIDRSTLGLIAGGIGLWTVREDLIRYDFLFPLQPFPTLTASCNQRRTSRPSSDREILRP